MKVVKEIFIYLLLLALIILILGIIFYDQLPSNKLVPTEVEYTLPEKLQEELDKTLSEEDEKEVLVTYTIEESDLDKYENNNQYNPGKIDPFADYSTGNSNSSNETNKDENSGNTNNNKNEEDKNNNSENSDNTSKEDNKNENTNSGNSNGGQLTETKPGK